jgi:tetratricopeptide (TPR) repeat protein
MNCRFFRFAALSLALAFIVPARAATPSPPLTDEECAAFGKQLASWLSTHDLEALEQSFDPLALLDRVMDGLDLSEKDADDFRAGALGEVKDGLIRQFGQVKKAQFLRVVQRPGGKRVLVRVHLKGGINYFEFVCARRASGKLKWVDMFIYITGDMMSNTIRTAALPMIAEMKKGILERLTGSESSYVEHLPEIQRAMGLLRDGKPAEAAPILKALPAEMQTNRSVLMLRLQVAQAVSESDYLKVIQDWETAYPNDSALALISIDGDVMRKNFTGAIAHVDVLDRLVGGDPYLNCIRGNIYFAAKNYVMVKRTANAALQADPHLAAAYDVLLNTSLAEEDFDETARILERFERAYPYVDMARAVKGAPTYSKFLLSPAYAEWIEQRSHAPDDESAQKK